MIVKVPVVVPPGTVTVDGTVAAELFDARETTNPPVGAAEVSVTVPVEFEPPETVVGDNVRPCSDGGFTVSSAVDEIVPVVAVIVAV